MNRVLLLSVAFLTVGLILVSAQAPKTQSQKSEAFLVERGEEWLAFSQAQRETYISGYVTGYLSGSHDACHSTNDLFEVGKAHQLGNDPVARCEARLATYSKTAAAYATVLTEFYEKHPSYRAVPYPYLLRRYLTDSKFKNADALYDLALKGQIRTTF